MAVSCTYCNEEDNDYMVQCDECDAWIHHTCAGVTEDIKNSAWKCLKCTNAQQEFNKASTSTNLMDTFSTPTLSGKLNKGHQVSDDYNYGSLGNVKKRDIKLELLQLEENRKLELAIIEKKFELLRSCVNEGSELDLVLNTAQTGKINNELINITPLQNVKSNVVSNGGSIMNDENKFENKINQNLLQNKNAQTSAVQSNDLLNFQQLSSRHAVPRDLPSFSGKPEEWLVFISSFENSTRICGFTYDENLLRLQRALKGKALDVSSKLMIPALVPEIMATLKMMFGRPDQIINSILSKIRMQPPVNMYKLESIITFALELKNLTASMEATGLESYYNNPMLVQELVEKLPAPMRMEWGRFHGKENLGDLKLLGDWLYEQAETASTVSSSSVFSSTDTERRKLQRVSFHKEEKKPSLLRHVI